MGEGKNAVPEREARFNVYVIELDRAVRESRKFREANPGSDPAKPCLYVGMTSRTPTERFAQHKAGYKASRYVKKYGTLVRHDLCYRYNPLTYEEACKMEVELAKRLRQQGHAVWQQ